MARSKFGSPTLDVEIRPEHYDRAVKSKSGGCLLAEAIKEQYPQFTGVTVDMATIRLTDRKAGRRYTYLAPPSAQHVLLSYDQGWPNPVNRVQLRRAVKIAPIKSMSRRSTEERSAHLEDLEARSAAGEELTPHERGTLTRMRNRRKRPAAVNYTRTEVKVDESSGSTVVYGGRPIPHGKAHPNLLRGQDRHFGAKLADPGEAFHEAVEAAVAERMAKAEKG